MASKKLIVDCICCWYDFLGFGSPFVDAGWDLTNKIADKSINRICSEAIDFRGFYSFADKTTRFHCNDGIATNYDLEQGKENEFERLKIITFLDGIITDYEIINATDKSNGYPGVRGVLGQIVGILGSSLDYRLFGHATERNPRKHWNPDPWTDRIARIQFQGGKTLTSY